jgi:hypothetical protein
MNELMKDEKFLQKCRHLAQYHIMQIRVWDDAGVARAWCKAIHTALVEAGFEVVPKTHTKENK